MWPNPANRKCHPKSPLAPSAGAVGPIGKCPVASRHGLPQKAPCVPAELISRLDIYIFRQVLLALVITTSGLTALIWLTQSLRFVDLVVNRGLSFFVFIHLTALLIPSFVAVILPITTYVVIQFVYQRLAGDRELTVMRAAGLSPWALARPALAVALLATMLGYGAQPVGRAAATSRLPTVPVGNPQPPGRLPAAGGRVHPAVRQADRLCPLARPGWHAARHHGGRWRAIQAPTPRSWPNGGG